MAGEIASAYVRIRPNMSGFQAETQSGVKSAFSGIGKVVAGAFAGVAAIGFGKEIVQGAAQLQKSVEVIRDDFGSAGDAVVRFNEKSASALGISARAGDETAAKFAVLFKNMGIGQGKAAEMTIGMEKLAGSLASIRGVDPADVLGKMSLAVAGNTRGLKQLGIVIDNHMIKQEALKLGLLQAGAATRTNSIADQELAIAKAKLTEAQSKYGSGTTQVAEAQIAVEKAQAKANAATQGALSTLSPAAKAQAIYALATEHLADFQKQAASHSGDLANQQRRLSAEWSNAKDALGTALLPVLSAVVGLLADKLPGAVQATEDKFRQIADEVRGPFNAGLDTAKGILEAVAGALKQTVNFLVQYQNIFLPISGAIGGVTFAIEAWTIATEAWTAVTEIAKATQAAFDVVMAANPIGLVALAIAGLVGALVVLYTRSNTAREIMNAIWKDIRVIGIAAFDVLKTYFLTWVHVVIDVFNVFKSVFTGDWRGAWNNFKKIFSDIWNGIKEVAGNVLDVIRTICEKQALKIGLAIIEPFSHIPKWLGGGWAQDLKKQMTASLEALEHPAATAGTNVGRAFGSNLATTTNTYLNGVSDAVVKMYAALGKVGSEALSGAAAAAASPRRQAGIIPAGTVPTFVPPKVPPPPGGGGGPLSVGDSGASSAAQSLATAKDALEKAFKALGDKAKQLGSELTQKMRDGLAAVHKEIQNIASKADVQKARDNLDVLKKEIGDRLRQVTETIKETNAFEALKKQVAILGTDVTPDVKTQMAAIRAEIGKAVTPAEVANLRAQMGSLKKELATQLTQLKNQISAEKTQFDNAWSQLTAGANAAFDKTTQKALAAMQVMVQTATGSFLFGGSLTQTPAEIALAQLQAAKQATDQAAALKAAQDAQAADLVAGSGATAEQLLLDAKAVADAKYNIQVSSLQTQAQAERDAAVKQLTDAQTAYQAQRDLLKSQLDQRVSLIQQGMADGTISAKEGMDDLVGILGDPAYGIDMQNSGFALGGALYKGLSDGLVPVYKLIDDLTRKMRQVGLLPKTVGAPISLPGGITVPAGVIGGGFGGGFPTTVADIADAVAQGTKPIVDAVNDQTKKTTDNPPAVTVNVDGGANTTARMALR